MRGMIRMRMPAISATTGPALMVMFIHFLRDGYGSINHGAAGMALRRGSILALARSLHRNVRSTEAELLVERRHAGTAGAKHPGHLRVVAHRMADQRAADALAAVRRCYHDHRDVAVEDAVAERAQETDDLALFNG